MGQARITIPRCDCIQTLWGLSKKVLYVCSFPPCRPSEGRTFLPCSTTQTTKLVTPTQHKIHPITQPRPELLSIVVAQELLGGRSWIFLFKQHFTFLDNLFNYLKMCFLKINAKSSIVFTLDKNLLMMFKKCHCNILKNVL